MIPTTVLGLFLFLLLVTPGLSYEMLRERRRPAVEESAFREASRIALASAAFDVAALLIFAVVRLVAPGALLDPGKWLADPHAYIRDHYALVGVTIGAFVVLAVGVAAGTDRLLRRQAPGDIRPGGIWFQLFRVDRPEGTVPWLSIRLSDGTDVAGFLSYYVSAEEPANREIALKQNAEHTGLQLRNKDATAVERLDGWSNVILRGDEITCLKVKYLPAASGSSTPRRKLFG